MQPSLAAAKKTVTAFMEVYLIKRDAVNALSFISETVFSIGTGEFELAENKAELLSLIEQEIEQDPLPFQIEYHSLEGVIQPSGHADIFGNITVHKILPQEKPFSMDIRLSVSLEPEREHNRYLITALHSSVPVSIQENREFYPFRFAGKTLDELQLKMKSEAFDILNDTLPGGIIGCYLEKEYPLYTVNEQLLQKLGFTYEEFLRISDEKFLHCIFPEDREVFLCAVKESAQTKESVSVQIRLLKKDGSFLWVLNKGKRAVSEDGRPVLLNVCLDITNLMDLQSTYQNRAELLQTKTEELENLTNNAPGGVQKRTADDKCEFIYLSDSFIKLVGYTREEIKLKFHNSLFNMIFPEDTAYVKEALSNPLEGKRIQLEYRMQTKTGRIIWVLERSELVEEDDNPYFYCTVLEITQKRYMEEQLRISEERLRIALSKTRHLIYEYIHSNHTVFHINDKGELYGLPVKMENVPYSLLENGVVLPDSADTFIHMYQKIDEGTPEATCDIHTKKADGSLSWNRITLTNLFDDTGKPVRAIGIIEDITKQKDAELVYDREKLYRNAILAGSVIFFEINFTLDIIERHTDHSHGLGADGSTYTEIFENTVSSLLHPDDKQSYFDLLSRDNILSAFKNGTREITLEHRRIAPTGKEIWMLTTLYLIEDTATRDIKGFSYLKNIDKQKRSALLLEYKSQRDPLTGLFNKESTETKIKDILKQQNIGQTHAFMMIDVDHFKSINDTFGHKYGDKILSEVANHIGDIFRRDDIIGRIGGDEFVVFVKDIRSVRLMDEKALDICRMFHQIALEQKHATDLSCSIGISIFAEHGSTFDELYEKADIALYEAKRLGRNRFAYYQECLSDNKCKSKENAEESSSFSSSKSKNNVPEVPGKRHFSYVFAHTNRKMISGISIIAILFSAIFSAFSFSYLGYLNRMTNNENWKYISKISTQMASILKNKFSTDLNALETSASVIELGDFSDEEDLKITLDEEKERWNFTEIALISKDGTWYYTGSKENFRYFQHPIQSMLKNDRAAYYSPLLYDGQNSILFIVPMENMQYNGKEISTLVALQTLNDVNKLFNTDLYNTESISYVINMRGSTVAASANAPASTYPLNALSKEQLCKGFTLEHIGGDISLQKQGYVKFNHNNDSYYLCYTPVGVWNWYLITIFPGNSVGGNYQFLFKVTAWSCLVITVMFLTLLLVLLLVQMKNKRNLEQIAYIDPVTGGSNKKHFESLALNRIHNGKQLYALVYTNIERFKLLNERFGRDTADEILKSIYYIIHSHLKDGEITGRLTADNFGILLQYDGKNELKKRLDEISKDIYGLTNHHGIHYAISMSYGVYLPDNLDADIITMLDRANLARKQTSLSRGNFKLYDNSFKDRLLHEKQLEDKMQDALDNHHFIVYLQPKYELKKETIAGAEALVRWKDPIEGMIYPNDFIPLFERNGFITRIDFYVFEVVCHTLQKWIQNGFSPIPISVNLSRANLNSPGFLNAYWRKMQEHNIPPHLIEFEFTETLVYDNVEVLNTLIEEIHKMGCTCSMDDFGSGYSSLNMLKNVSVDTLKLDKAFFDEMGRKDSRGREIIKGVISLAKELSLKTVSEGVETTEQVNFLKEIGGDLVQGYVYSKPIDIKEFEQLLFQQEIKESAGD